MFRGKARRSSLGSYPDVGLAEARRKRDDECAQIRQGIDPVAARKADRARACIKQVKTITFQECAEAYIKTHEVGWRHPGSVQNWRGSFCNWVYPIIGKLLVEHVDKDAVMTVLEQDLQGTTLWVARAKTAEKVRSRIECVLDWAEARDYRKGDNPARWRGPLKQLLPPVSKIYKSKHLAALPYAELPEFMQALRARKQNTGRWEGGSVSARALEFLILTAARRTEVTGARWDEINRETRTWIIPGDRMKSGREHRVPLSPDAMAVLDEMQALRARPSCGQRWQLGVANGEFIFPGAFRCGGVNGEMLRRLLSTMGRDDLTVHGFRSTFRDWIADRTNYSGELAELALAHAIRNQTEAAYRRGDQLEKRRPMMDDWANYCAGRWSVTADVIPMRSAAASSIGLSTP
jgi:integrase